MPGSRVTGDCVTFQFHAGVEALFEPTSGTLFAGGDSDRAGGSPEAHVILLVLDGSFEKALAALAGKDAVMEARDLVAADGTRAVDQLLARDASLGGQRRRVLGKVGWVEALLLARSFAAVVGRVVRGQTGRMGHVGFAFDLQVADAGKRSGRSGTREWSGRVSVEERRRREFPTDQPSTGSRRSITSRQHGHVPRLDRRLSGRRAEWRRRRAVAVLRPAVLRMDRVLRRVRIIARQGRAGPVRVRRAQAATGTMSRLSWTGRW